MAIERLSKWDFSIEFMLYEAAALIVGIDPAEIYNDTPHAKDNPRIYEYHEHPQIKPVVDRMKVDFFSATELYLAMRDGEWKNSWAESSPELVLRSRGMEAVSLKIGSECLPLDPAVQNALEIWSDSGEEKGIYETAKFTRSEITRWLSANCLKSVYRFDNEQSENIQTSADQPIGNRERETLLTIIAALCKVAGYDTKKHSKTAGLILNEATEMGFSIGETTIENHLKKISDGLAGRMK